MARHSLQIQMIDSSWYIAVSSLFFVWFFFFLLSFEGAENRRAFIPHRFCVRYLRTSNSASVQIFICERWHFAGYCYLPYPSSIGPLRLALSCYSLGSRCWRRRMEGASECTAERDLPHHLARWRVGPQPRDGLFTVAAGVERLLEHVTVFPTSYCRKSWIHLLWICNIRDNN